ncbi:branched-chain amino acid ABC transporter substrate-binding protein [soil metagenome]
MTNQLRPLVLALSVAAAFAAPSVNAEVVKIAYIDAVTGPFAPLIKNSTNSFEYYIEQANKQKWAGDNTLELVIMDGKGSPQESLRQLKLATDQGIRYVIHQVGSGVALALVDAINKHNERNPGKEVVYFNGAAIDPDLTNSKCSFYHFRFDANTDMKMEGISNELAKDKNIKKVYIIGQNYAHGHQFTKAGKDMLKRKRPDIEIVGDDLHPIGQVKDFSPYIAKIKASGADTVLTGNWGADLILLVKAAKDAGLKTNFYTFYAFFDGTPTAMGADAADRVKMIAYWHNNAESNAANADVIKNYKNKYKLDFEWLGAEHIIGMMSKAMKDSKSTDPVKVAFALEGMKYKGLSGDVEMRKTDHQLQEPLYIATWTKAGGPGVKNDSENTGYGWKTDVKLDSFVASQPTSCNMTRPAKS